ncbi:hypothetical protein BS329_15475 [Amycolatopsis coloradensis]|uniref:Uncharacterized protein n=2 Tax=Amycolatopsis coloradensis TaxID=76021 RepID=A0A1R0KUA1_9PSEU|nr:hypothetical protein BS329_15475 [Amycolatopsis coloradensis]
MYGENGQDHAVLLAPETVTVGEIVGTLCGLPLQARPGSPGQRHLVCVEAARRASSAAVA